MERLDATRYAGKVNQLAIEHGHSIAKPGVTLLEIDAAIEKYIVDHKCSPVFKGYKGYPASSCLSPNDVVVHGIPNGYALKYGDLLTIDVGSEYHGWMVDSARTFVIKDADTQLTDPEKYDVKWQERLIYAADVILDAELSVIKNGCSLLNILKAAESAAQQSFVPKSLGHKSINICFQWGGHQIGRQLHIDPFIPNAIDPALSSIKRWQLEREYDKYKLTAGQVICLEPVVTFGSTDIILDDDGWTVRSKDGSLVAHTERCLLVTETGHEILS